MMIMMIRMRVVMITIIVASSASPMVSNVPFGNVYKNKKEMMIPDDHDDDEKSDGDDDDHHHDDDKDDDCDDSYHCSILCITNAASCLRRDDDV